MSGGNPGPRRGATPSAHPLTADSVPERLAQIVALAEAVWLAAAPLVADRRLFEDLAYRAALSELTCRLRDEARVLAGGEPPGRTIGVGQPVLGRPDHGHDMFQLVCDTCGAGWVGPTGEPCWYCERREQQRDEAMATAPPTAPATGIVWCPTHRRAWRGDPGEVHGVHDPEHCNCNERGTPLPRGGDRRAR